MADGWYEWVKDPDAPKMKQPYFIRLKSQTPMFFAALAEIHPRLEPHEGDGLVIITATSDQRMVDIHDQRPVVFSPERARGWVETALGREQAEELVMGYCQPTENFEWFLAGKTVWNVKNQGVELTTPMDN